MFRATESGSFLFMRFTPYRFSMPLVGRKIKRQIDLLSIVLLFAINLDIIQKDAEFRDW
jgi:hypothetical protein